MDEVAVATIKALEDRRYQAMLDGDVETLGRLCADDLIYTHSLGDRDDRPSYLAKVSDGHFRYHRIERPEERIVVLGDTAVVAGRMVADVTVAGAAKSLDNRSLAVWVKTADGWRFLAYQPTPVSGLADPR